MRGTVFGILAGISVPRSIRARLNMVLAAMALVLTGLGGAALASLEVAQARMARELDAPLRGLAQAQAATRTLHRLQLDYERNLRRQTGLAELAAGLRTSEDGVGHIRESLAGLGALDASGRSRADIAQAQTRLAELQALLDAARLRGARPDDAAVSQLHASLAETLGRILDGQSEAVERLRREAGAHMLGARHRVLAAGALALFLAIGLCVFVRRTVLVPLEGAEAAARRISAGELDAPIPEGADDELGALLGALSDMQGRIRERLGSERAHREQAEARFQQAVDASQNAILLSDAGGAVVFASRQARQLFGLEGWDAERTPLAMDALFDARGRLRHMPSSVPEPGLLCLRGNGGAELFLRLSASPAPGGGALWIWSDVSEARQTQAALREAQARAVAANRAKGEFLATMSHELRTPLNAVLGFSEVLAGRVDAQTRPAEADMIRHIHGSGRHLLSIVEDILALVETGVEGGVESGGEDAGGAGPALPGGSPGRVDMRAVATEVADAHRGQARAQGVTVAVAPSTDAHPLHVTGYPARLRQVVGALVDNAVRFNVPGGRVDIRLEAREGVGAAREVVLGVRDMGSGFDMADLSRLLEPFTQGEEGMQRRWGGTGIGLSVARHWAERHGGRLAIRSAPGAGTDVELILPAAEISVVGAEVVPAALAA